MKFEVTNEELEAIRFYLNEKYVAINQLLTSDIKTDIALFYDEKINYNRKDTGKEIECIKIIYELMQKVKKQKANKESWSFSRGTNLFEIEKLKNETFIDRFLSATTMKQKAEAEYSLKWEEPAIMYICGMPDVPYINIDDILGIKSDEIIIAPFTKVISIKELDDLKNNNIYKSIKSYSISIENQELQEINEAERKGLYNYILDQSDNINDKLSEIIRLQNENNTNYQNIRKLEQLLAKYDTEIEKKEQYKDYTESERQADLDDIERITKELDILKETTSRVFDIIKEDNKYIENWKRNIAVYLMAECKEIQKKYDLEIKIIEEIKEEKEKKIEEIQKEKILNIEKSDLEKIKEQVEKECTENINSSNNIIENINKLIKAQQNYAKIANDLNCSYSALNDSFEMKKQADVLAKLINSINELRIKYLEDEDKTILKDNLIEISKVNIQISTLINYLNNPRVSVGKAKINRFEEMQIIEENELKRNIFKYSLETRGTAELKKLRDDIEILKEKSPFKKIIGLFTGRNKLDEFMIEQIEVMENAIKATLSKNVRLDYNYSIHNIIAEIKMFIHENKDDELIVEDVNKLVELEDALRRNFSIDDAVVEEIIFRKESKNLPIDTKISKKDLIEIETYRFLNKYGYDNMQNKSEEKKYYDTTANEIGRIAEYINTSGILKDN
ncbi:MAG: hypothetical protein ACI4UE_00885 [Candidatus Scatovivens sp.]